MKKRVKRISITIAIILGVIIFAIIIKSNGNGTSLQIAKCIGKNTILYTQLGCHACENQEKLFGENYNQVTVIDCFYEMEKCSEIQYTPTWIIKGEKYTGVQSIEKLKEITGC